VWRDIIEVEKEQGVFKKSKCYVRQQKEPIVKDKTTRVYCRKRVKLQTNS